MARARRKVAVAHRLEYELGGVAAIALAVLTGVALVATDHTGIAGRALAGALHAAFGAAAGWFPVLVALVGAIVFLEIDVPRLMARYGGAACAYFVTIDAALGGRGAGGSLGNALYGALRALVGDVGTAIVLVVVALGLTAFITGLSFKRAIGWGIARGAELRATRRAAREAAPAASPGSLREAFRLPSLPARSVAAAPAPAAVAVREPEAPVPYDAQRDEAAQDADDDLLDEDDDLEDDEDDLDDDAFEDDEVDEDDDEDDQDDGVVVMPPAAVALAPVAVESPPVVSGDYESAVRDVVWRLPDLSLFDPPQAQKADDSSRASVLEDTLASFGVGGKVVHIERGPSITRYELKPERGVKISRIASLADDLALALAATSVRIEAPIPGKSAVGIEVPNASVSIVAIREILEAMPQRGSIPPLTMALGKDITGRPVMGDLGKMPHLLVAGATGSGKSVCLNTIIASLLVSATPDQVKMLMIDPKRVELTVYNGIPHLANEVITDPRLAAGALNAMTREMDQRYERFAKAGVRKIEEYNAKYPDEALPYYVIIIDELADLMLVAPAKVETTICRLAQLARATGMHLIVATQRPSVDVITGLVKANIPSRIAFAVSSQIDSRTILDMGGAERLLGRGDMLYLPIDAPKPVRAQGALITGAEVHRLVDFWSRQGNGTTVAAEPLEIVPVADDDEGDGKKREVDPLWLDAAVFLVETKIASSNANVGSTAQLQSRFSIGHPRAVRLMNQLERFGIVGPNEGPKPRRVVVESPADLDAIRRVVDPDGAAQTELF